MTGHFVPVTPITRSLYSHIELRIKRLRDASNASNGVIPKTQKEIFG